MDPAPLSTSQDGTPDRAGSAPSAIPLADVLARDIPLHWYESVALVAGLCATLVEQQIPGVPEPEAVSLTREGRVRVARRGRQLSVSALPRLLHGLLANGTPPPPLRLFALHAMAPDHTASIGEFAASLEYYERPGREDLVQAVYQRVVDTPPGAGPGKKASFDLDEPRPTPSQTAPRADGRHRLWIAAAAFLVCAACAVVYGMVTAPRATATEAGPPDLRAIADEIGDAARTVTGAIREKLAGVVATTAVPPALSPPAGSPPTPPTRRAVARRAASALETAPAPQVISPVAVEEWDQAPITIPAAPEIIAFPFAAADGTVIYSSDASAVTPPVLRDPHRLPASLQVAEENAANAIEILIDEAGAVERVTMVRPSTHLTDMMLLGAAKTWKFEPATREGLPVKYRLRLDWSEAER